MTPPPARAWVLLEARLRTRDEHTILVPFDNLGLHGQVLRDMIAVDWLILLDAGDSDSLHALDCADFDALEVAQHIDLPNPTLARYSVCSGPRSPDPGAIWRPEGWAASKPGRRG